MQTGATKKHEHGLSASSSGSKLQSPVKSPSPILERQSARQMDRLRSPSNLATNNRAADRRSMRRIIANDPEWTLSTVPDLVELTIRHIVSNFASQYAYRPIQ